MILHYTSEDTDAEHWGVSQSATKPGDILVQLGDVEGESIRISISPDQALEFAEKLNQAVKNVHWIKKHFS